MDIHNYRDYMDPDLVFRSFIHYYSYKRSFVVRDRNRNLGPWITLEC